MIRIFKKAENFISLKEYKKETNEYRNEAN